MLSIEHKPVVLIKLKLDIRHKFREKRKWNIYQHCSNRSECISTLRQYPTMTTNEGEYIFCSKLILIWAWWCESDPISSYLFSNVFMYILWDFFFSILRTLKYTSTQWIWRIMKKRNRKGKKWEKIIKISEHHIFNNNKYKKVSKLKTKKEQKITPIQQTLPLPLPQCAQRCHDTFEAFLREKRREFIYFKNISFCSCLFALFIPFCVHVDFRIASHWSIPILYEGFPFALRFFVLLLRSIHPFSVIYGWQDWNSNFERYGDTYICHAIINTGTSTGTSTSTNETG